MLKTGKYSYPLLVGRVIESLIDSQPRFRKQIMEIDDDLNKMLVKKELEDKMTGMVSNSEKAFEECIIFLKERYNVDDFELENDDIYFEEGLDEILIVVDRDAGKDGRSGKDGRPEWKYFSFIEKCKNNHYYPIVTNPKFELWILFHYKIDGIVDDLKNSSECKKLIDKKMSELKIGKKSKFDKTIKSLDVALKNSKKFCNNLDELEHETGSNIPELIKKIGYFPNEHGWISLNPSF
jgi:hypothetical protein